MYEAYREGAQDAATPSTATGDSSYYYSDASQGQQWTPASAGGGGGGGELWAVDQQLATAGPPHSSHFSGYESYDYPGSEYYGYNNNANNVDSSGGGGGGGDQQVAANRVASWSAEANQQWYYGGAESYDGAGHYEKQQGPSGGSNSDQGWGKTWSAESNQQWGAGGGYNGDGAVTPSDYYPAWTPETPDTPSDGTATGYGYGYGYGGGADGGEGWAVAAAAETPQDWSGSTPESAEYYGYDATAGGALGATTDSAAVAGGGAHQAWSGEGATAATGWDTGWATPETAEAPTITANGSEDLSLASNGFAGGGDGGGAGGGSGMSLTGGDNTAATPPSGGSSGRPWSVNEFGQRVSGDWVEYYDESAQAAYYYNTISGEVRGNDQLYEEAGWHK